MNTHLADARTKHSWILNPEDLPTRLRARAALNIEVTQEMQILVTCRKVKNDPAGVREDLTGSARNMSKWDGGVGRVVLS